MIQTDPNYAPAYALQAQVALLLSDAVGAYGTVSSVEAIPASQALVEKALSIAPDLGEAYAVKGLGLSQLGQSEDAIAALRRAVALSPNNLDANMWLASELYVRRRHLDTAETLTDLFNKDPLFMPVAGNLMLQLRTTGQHDRAEDVVERLQSIAPDMPATKTARAILLFHKGDMAAAARVMQSVYEETPGVANGIRTADVLFMLDAFEEIPKYKIFPIYDVWATSAAGETAAGVSKAKALLEAQPENGFFRNEYIIALSANNQDTEILHYYKETWDSIREFETDVINVYSRIPPSYAELAMAFKALGEEALFQETMQRWRTSIDIDRAGGHKRLFEFEAKWQNLSGDYEAALAQLEAGFEAYTLYPPSLLERRSFDALKGNPGFEALKAKNLIRVNEERAKLGLSALTLAE